MGVPHGPGPKPPPSSHSFAFGERSQHWGFRTDESSPPESTVARRRVTPGRFESTESGVRSTFGLDADRSSAVYGLLYWLWRLLCVSS
uniref:Uncharacterized protein n=1 Tax=Steinernema glaseri TaxID=37863 RepID=A0A1I8ARV9_9BILA